ncbi:hypothetical protein TKK_0018240 [Trichogramma kaykai]
MFNGEDIEDIEVIQKEGDELFLDLIKDRECLWNRRCKEYHLIDVKDNAMQEVAAILGDTEQENRSGAGASTRKKWIWYDYINNFTSSKSTSRKPFSNVQDCSIEEREPTHLKKNKRKQSQNPVEIALNNVNASLSGIMQQLSNPPTEEENTEDINASIGQLVIAALNQFSPKTAKKKKKQLMKLVYDDDSESD